MEERKKKMIADYHKTLLENYERLRLSLNLPDLESPQIDANYAEEHGVAFLHHGPRMDMDPMIAYLEKIMNGKISQ